MIQLMLTDLRCPSAEFLLLFLPVHIVVFNFNILITRRTADAGQGKTSFLRLIRRVFFTSTG